MIEKMRMAQREAVPRMVAVDRPASLAAPRTRPDTTFASNEPMITIAAADMLGLPVSTTHVLSSGVAGTMTANLSGLQMRTVRNIALAWVLTMPVTMILAGAIFAGTAGSALKELSEQAIAPQRDGYVMRKVE